METIIKKLRRLAACGDARKWLEKQPDVTTAWKNCPRGDWMLWTFRHAQYDHKALVSCTCECTRLALPYADGPVALNTIEVMEAWVRGEASLNQVRAAKRAAEAAARATVAAAWAALRATAAAGRAAELAAIRATARADGAAEWTAFWAAEAAGRADGDAAREKIHQQTSDIVRKYFPQPPMIV